jgi:hypothetical protein
MFTVRTAQIRVLQKSLDRSFAQRTMQQIKDSGLPDTEGIDDTQLLEMVDTGIVRAQARGFTWESSIAGFVYLMFSVAPNFDVHPAFEKVLSEPPPKDENARLESLFQRVNKRDWEAARLKSDWSIWENTVQRRPR